MVYKTDPNQAAPRPPKKPTLKISRGQARPRPPSPPDVPDKEIQDLTGAEKQQLIRTKRRRLIKAADAPQPAIMVQPISSVRPDTPPSPSRSPSPLLPDADTSPPVLEVPPPALSQSPPPIPAEAEASPSPARVRQTTPNPPDTSTRPDPVTTSTPQAEPYLTIHTNTFSKLSFFPTEPNGTIPKGLYQAFNLPADQGHYPEDPDDLTTVTIQHLGQALGGVSRLLKYQETAPDQAEVIRKLQAELQQIKADHGCLQEENALLQADHNRLRAEHESMELEQEISSTIARSLQVQLLEKEEEVRSLEVKATDLVEERTLLLQDRVEKAAKMEGLQADVDRLTAGLREKELEVGKTTTTVKQLEEETEKLKAEAQTLLTDHRPAIISEYRRSAELREEVLEEFGKGYAYAKSMVIKAGVNPITLGFSSDEDSSDTEGGPSGAQDPSSPEPSEPPSPQNSPHM